MAIAAVAGLASAAGAAAASLSLFGLGALGSFAAAFAIGAGLSMVSRALMPTPSMGQQMSGTTMTVREPASTRKIVYGRARVGGSIVYLDSTGEENKFMHMVIAIAGHAIDAYEEIYFNDQKIWDGGSFVGSWGTYVYLGLHDGTQTTADSTLVSASSQWTTDHKLLDTAYIYVRLEYDAEQFANGLPNVSAIVRGKKVYNPTTATTVWTQNPALIVRDYLLDTKYGLAEVTANINATALSTAQVLCDQQVALTAGGTQNRYVCDGVLNTGSSRQDNIESLLSSMAGRLIHSGGEYFISGAAYTAPTVTIDESVMVAAVSIQTKQSRRSIYNGVKGVFLSSEDNYILADYPSVISSTYSAADGDPIYLDMPLPFTTSSVRAQRLAKLALLQSRQQTQITVPCNLAALKFKAGDTIMITNAKIGWTSKVFDVLGYSFDLSLEGEIIVNVSAIETASEIYDWAASDEEDYLSGGEVSLYNGSSVFAPTSFTGTASTTVNNDGNIVPQITSTWVASADVFVVRYDYQWSTDGSTWNTVDVDGLQHTISPLISGQLYYTRVRAINDIGVRSSYATANVSATGDTTAPAVPTSLSATAGYKSISLKWTNPADKDFSNVEVYRSTSSGGTYAEVATVGGGFSAVTEFLNGGIADATAFYYKFKSVDYSGNKSAFTGVVNATTNAEAINGSDGTSTFTAPIFKRSATALSAPTGGTFNFGTNTLTAPSGWSIAVPTGTDPIYQATFQFSVSGDTGTVTAGTWSTPVIIAENGGNGTDGTDGTDGTNGANGLSTFVFPVYQRSSSSPSAPSGGSYNFTNNTITAPSNWSASIPSGTDPIYASTTQAQIAGATGTDATLSWTSPILFVQNGSNGIDGDNGSDGINTAPVYAYKRSASALASTNKPATARTWTFSTATFNDNDLGNSWTASVPSGSDDLYICAAVASSSGATDSVAASDWSAPNILGSVGSDGTDGTDGTNGFNTAVVYAYKRSGSTVTDKPSTTRTWTFSTATFNNNDLGNSFTGTVPAGTDNLYVCNAIATSTSSTDSVTGTSDWSAPQLLASNGTDGTDGTDGTNGTDGTDGTDGTNGAAGIRSADGYLYYSVSQASAPSSPSATEFVFNTGSFGGLTANWSTTPPTNTGGDAKYWATYWHVTEAEFDGTQTRTFNTPFNSVQFDGLVTFTNLNSELANASSSEITTINGGLLKTGTIDVSQVNISGTASAGISIKSAATGSRMEIESDVIKIYEGSTLRVKLGNLA